MSNQRLGRLRIVQVMTPEHGEVAPLIDPDRPSLRTASCPHIAAKE
jgi:hypothetical protein